MHCTYKVSHPSGKFYIGKTTLASIKRGYRGTGKIIQDCFKKYPKSEWSIEILSTFPTSEEAYKHEASLVTADLLKMPGCLNVNLGGQGGPIKSSSNYKWSDERKQKHAERVKAAWESGKYQSRQLPPKTDEWRAAQKKGTIAWVTLNKDKAIARGKALGHANKDRKHTAESRANMGACRAGKPRSAETKHTIAQTVMGNQTQGEKYDSAFNS